MKVLEAHIRGDRGVALTRYKCGQMGLLFHERVNLDYGVDAVIEIVEGEHATGRLIAVQIKCGSSYLRRREGDSFVFAFDDGHLRYWNDYAVPTIVVLADDEEHVCYWAELSRGNATKTGTNYKVLVPKSQILGEGSRQQLLDIANPVVANSAYSLISEQDNSAGNRREISHHVLLNDQAQAWTKSRIHRVVLQVTAEARNSDYYRDELTKMRLEDLDPEIVRVFVYHNRHEMDCGRYLVRAIWAAESVFEKENPPIGVRSGLHLVWNDKYEEISSAVAKLRTTKQVYLDFAKPRLSALVHLALKNFDKFDGDEPPSRNALQEMKEEIGAVLARFDDSPIPPIECVELDNAVEAVIGLTQNAGIYADQMLYRSDGRTEHEFHKYIKEAYERAIIARHELQRVSS